MSSSESQIGPTGEKAPREEEGAISSPGGSHKGMKRPSDDVCEREGRNFNDETDIN